MTLEELEQVRALFRAYGAFLARDPDGGAGIRIDGFEHEIAGLPGIYASPGGVILLAQSAGEAAGCVALRPLYPMILGAQRALRTCEMKRLWIDEAYRKLGLGRKLVQAAIAWAEKSNYEAIYLDTAPAAMPAAEKLYRDLGFEEVDRYNDNPVPDIVFFRLDLRSAVRPQEYPGYGHLV